LVDWRIGQPAGYQEWQLSIAVARFDNGWMVACIFSPDEAPANAGLMIAIHFAVLDAP